MFVLADVVVVLMLNDFNGLIILYKNIMKNESVEVIGWGKYEINNNSFQIGWHDWKLLLIKNNDKAVKKDSPWQGMRKYKVLLKDQKLVLTSVSGLQSWELDRKSLVYTDKEWGEDKDEVIRYWKRIP